MTAGGDHADRERLEFGSAAYLAVLLTEMRRRLTAADLRDIHWSQSEEYTNPPRRLLKPGRRTIGWCLRVDDGRVDTADDPSDDVELKTTVDYATVLPLMRATADEISEKGIGAHLRDRMEQKGDREHMPKEVRGAFDGFHDVMARRTR